MHCYLWVECGKKARLRNDMTLCKVPIKNREFSPEAMAKVTVTTFIKEELKNRLKALADVERRSVSQMVAILIERAIKEEMRL